MAALAAVEEEAAGTAAGEMAVEEEVVEEAAPGFRRKGRTRHVHSPVYEYTCPGRRNCIPSEGRTHPRLDSH